MPVINNLYWAKRDNSILHDDHSEHRSAFSVKSRKAEWSSDCMTTSRLISLTTVMQYHLFDTNPPSTCCLVISWAIIGNYNDGSWHLEIVMYYSGEPTVICLNVNSYWIPAQWRNTIDDNLKMITGTEIDRPLPHFEL